MPRKGETKEETMEKYYQINFKNGEIAEKTIKEVKIWKQY